MKTAHWLLLGAVLALPPGYWYWQASNTNKNTPETKTKPVALAPVTVAKASLGDLQHVLELVGRTEASETVSLRSRVDGQVLAVHFNEGQAVRKGDVLIQLDPNDLKSRLAQAEGAVAKDKALLAKARADLQRYQELRQKNFISEEKLADLRTNLQSMEAAIQASTAAADLARLQLEYTTIRAPISGVTSVRQVFPGSAVKTNDTALVVINRSNPLLVSFPLPERYLGKIRTARNGGEVTVQVRLPESNGVAYSGKLSFIDNAVDPTTGTIQLKARLENNEQLLTPGQYVQVSLSLDSLKNQILIPSTAIDQGPEGPQVFVIVGEDTVELRRVQITASHKGIAAIGKGLQAGDRVVTEGQMRLTPKAKVAIKEAKNGV